MAFSDQRNKQSLAHDLHDRPQPICSARGRPQYPVLRFAITSSNAFCRCVTLCFALKIPAETSENSSACALMDRLIFLSTAKLELQVADGYPALD
jgi:hypothetical protein